MNIAMPGHTAELYRHSVAYADTDAGGIVYHGRYLEIAERARNRILYEAGFTYSGIARQWGVMFVVRNVEMTFHAPAALDDELVVATSLTRCDPSRTRWLTRIERDAQPVAAIKLELVAVDVHDRGIRRHPEALLEALARHLKS